MGDRGSHVALPADVRASWLGKLLKGGVRGGYKALCCPARNDLRCTTFSKSVGKKHPILKAPGATLSARFLLHRLALHSKQTILTR